MDGSRCGHEVDQLFNGIDQRRLDIPVGRDTIEDEPPEHSRIVLSTNGRDHTFLPGGISFDPGPLLDSDCLRLDRLPYVHIRMTDDQHVRIGYAGGDSELLASSNQMVDEHTKAALPSRPELGDPFEQLIDSMEWFNHYALTAKVVTPDLLYELGIVNALDPDPTRLCRYGSRRRGSDGSRGRALDGWRNRLGRRNEFDGLSVQEQYTRVWSEIMQISALVLKDNPLAGSEGHDDSHCA